MNIQLATALIATFSSGFSLSCWITNAFEKRPVRFWASMFIAQLILALLALLSP